MSNPYLTVPDGDLFRMCVAIGIATFCLQMAWTEWKGLR